MKIRPVTCIHFAAYLLSALVLGVSAFSYYRYIHLEWIDGDTITSIESSNGEFVLCRMENVLKESKSFKFDIGKNPHHFFANFSDPRDENFIQARGGFIFGGDFTRESNQFLGIAYVGIVHDGEEERQNWFYFIQDKWLLIPPLSWMCGFHLFRLRRRWRAGRDVQLLTPAESPNSD